jgi:membrane protein DedA with SNARE-associated domain
MLVAGRWLPACGTIGAVLTGTLRWRLPRFTPASVVGSALWSTYVALMGFLGSEIIGAPLAGLVVSLAVAAVIGITSGILVKRSHRNSLAKVPERPSLGEEPLPAG